MGVARIFIVLGDECCARNKMEVQEYTVLTKRNIDEYFYIQKFGSLITWKKKKCSDDERSIHKSDAFAHSLIYE